MYPKIPITKYGTPLYRNEVAQTSSASSQEDTPPLLDGL